MVGMSVSSGIDTETDFFRMGSFFKITWSSGQRRCSCLANGVKDTDGDDTLHMARGEITSDNFTSSEK